MTGKERTQKILKTKNQIWEERASEVKPGDILEFTGPFGLGRIAGEESPMVFSHVGNGMFDLFGKYIDKGDKFLVIEDITTTRSFRGIEFKSNLKLKCLSFDTNKICAVIIASDAWTCHRRLYDEINEKHGDEIDLELIPNEDDYNLWIKGLEGKVSEVFAIHRGD